MENCNAKWKIILTFFIAVFIFALLILILTWKSGKNPNYKFEALARCLADKGVIMYGAEWCSHCQNQKKAFGEAFKLISYVECPKNPAQCLAAGIQGYPTWTFIDGQRLEGEQELNKLAEASGCVLPSEIGFDK